MPTIFDPFDLHGLTLLVQDWSSPAGSELVKLLASTAPMMQAAG